MTDAEAAIKFSLNLDSFQIEIGERRIEIAKGLSFIASQSIRFGRLDALAIENMIYVIEEILEQLKLGYHTQRTAQTSDELMRQLSALFFNHAAVIDRMLLEHAFNEFTERLEYYTAKAEPDLTLLAYFVFIREMMHHLNVVKIHLKS